MPLSKARDKARKRLVRLDARMRNELVQPIPLYNPSKHRIGDTVIMLRGGRRVQATIPELDAEGRAMPDYD